MIVVAYYARNFELVPGQASIREMQSRRMSGMVRIHDGVRFLMILLHPCCSFESLPAELHRDSSRSCLSTQSADRPSLFNYLANNKGDIDWELDMLSAATGADCSGVAEGSMHAGAPAGSIFFNNDGQGSRVSLVRTAFFWFQVHGLLASLISIAR